MASSPWLFEVTFAPWKHGNCRKGFHQQMEVPTDVPLELRINGCKTPKIGGKKPKWMVNILESPIKMDDLGVLLFLETPKWLGSMGYFTPRNIPFISR